MSRPSQLSKEDGYSKIGLARYYLQFCAVNSQLGNHSGALISARKALNIVHKELIQWDRHADSKLKQKQRHEHE